MTTPSKLLPCGVGYCRKPSNTHEPSLWRRRPLGSARTDYFAIWRGKGCLSVWLRLKWVFANANHQATFGTLSWSSNEWPLSDCIALIRWLPLARYICDVMTFPRLRPTWFTDTQCWLLLRWLALGHGQSGHSCLLSPNQVRQRWPRSQCLW